MRTPLLALALAAPLAAQYGTRFDDDAGWTLTSSHPVYGFAVDDDPPGRWNSAPSSLNVQYAEGETVYSVATSPDLDLAALASPELSFRTWSEIAEDTCLNDLRLLVVRDAASNGIRHQYCLSKRAPSGGAYAEYVLPLDPGWGVVRVQFVFNSVDGFANQGDGWFVDDVYLREATAGCPAPLYHCWGNSHTASSAGGWIDVSGSTSLAADDLVLHARNLVPNQAGLFFFGPAEGWGPLGQGFLCVAGPHRRLGVVPTGGGLASLAVDYASPPGDQLVAGTTWHFQYWFRDTGWGAPSNSTDAVALTFCP